MSLALLLSALAADPCLDRECLLCLLGEPITSAAVKPAVSRYALTEYSDELFGGRGVALGFGSDRRVAAVIHVPQTCGDRCVGGVPFGAGYEEFLRHPTAGVNIGALGGGHSSLTQYNARVNKVKVMSASGAWNPAGTDVTPTCISCHKAHGNGNAFGLIFRSGSGTLTEDGDANGVQYENLCGQCHVQASAFAK